MNDIYDNLDNYDDFNKIDELKNENKELKYKIEEFTSAINKLQKDFDNLAAEHKKLQLNYSSLLKTAKAEIERKTCRIKELNIEKDKLVINASQNFKNNFNKFRSERLRGKSDKDSDSKSLNGQSEKQKTKNQITKEECNNGKNVPTAELTSMHNTNVLNVTTEAEKYSKSGTDNVEENNEKKERIVCKENDPKLLNKLSNRHTETTVKKITNRRKSMPILRHELKLSTDEESESSTITAENNMCYKLRDEGVKQLSENNYHNKKVSETHSFENNYLKYQDSLSYSFRNKSNWHSNNDKYRSRDHYDSSQKYSRWNLSPDRSYHRTRREHMNDYHQRQEYNNRRTYESPPREKSYHQSRSRDRRSYYNRDHYRDYLSHRYDNERYAEKRKQNDMDEPNYKRSKLDYAHQHIEEERWQKESEINKLAMPTPLDYDERFSCQSPDFVHSDFYSSDPIKEIKDIALINLEDPRLTSKKYKIVKENDKEFLSTIIGRNVELALVNNNWGFKSVPMPRALLEAPSFDIVPLGKNIELGIDYQTSQAFGDSCETSGHINNQQQYTDCEGPNKSNIGASDSLHSEKREETEGLSKSNRNDIDNNKKVNSGDINENKINKVSTEPLATKCRIPKLQINSRASTDSIEPINCIEKSSECIEKNGTIDSKDNLKRPHKSKSMPHLTLDSKILICANKDDELALATKIVAADLILSDDPSDVNEPKQTVSTTPSKPKSKKRKNEVRKPNKNDTKKCINYSKIRANPRNKVKRSSMDKDKDKIIETAQEHPKKSKSQNKSQEDQICQVVEADTTKTDKTEKNNKTHEIKTKFNELFGDSNSLITPDDLGIGTVCEPETEAKLVTMFDNTQDAVDLNLKNVEDVLVLKPKLENPLDDSLSLSKNVQPCTLKAKADCSIKTENMSQDTLLHINKMKTEKSIIVKECGDIYKNLSSDTSKAVKTIIISSGIQPQYKSEEGKLIQLQNTVSVNEVLKSVDDLALKALATSTPAKPIQQEASKSDMMTVNTDCSTTNSTNSVVNTLSQTVDQIYELDSQKDPDVPDVRIFVKRRRKVKK
ncbi:general transcriptional corepressor trfA-like isoform X2 [Battus philenor]|uniref:general transcriptional corepressor trfA-like isoform X2 n=1 Tax=Battus philenor TaxID=42288 RepID=UPI0035CF3469